MLTVGHQQTFFRNNTCELFVENSLNLNCSGGFYLFPKTKLLNTCKKKHYKVGDSSMSCHSGTSHCLACDCNPAGSSNTECIVYAKTIIFASNAGIDIASGHLSES